MATALLVGCSNFNGQGKANQDKSSDQVDTSADPAVAERELDWTKPQLCVNEQNDTIARWVYDASGQLSQLYILGELFQDEYVSENIVGSSYCKFDEHGRLTAVVTGDEENSFRYEFIYDHEEEAEEEEKDDDDYAYSEKDIVTEYDDFGRVIYRSFRIKMSEFAATLTYEGRVCQVDAAFIVPVVDELGMLLDVDPKENDYYYTIYY